MTAGTRYVGPTLHPTQRTNNATSAIDIVLIAVLPPAPAGPSGRRQSSWRIDHNLIVRGQSRCHFKFVAKIAPNDYGLQHHMISPHNGRGDSSERNSNALTGTIRELVGVDTFRCTSTYSLGINTSSGLSTSTSTRKVREADPSRRKSEPRGPRSVFPASRESPVRPACRHSGTGIKLRNLYIDAHLANCLQTKQVATCAIAAGVNQIADVHVARRDYAAEWRIDFLKRLSLLKAPHICSGSFHCGTLRLHVSHLSSVSC